jgi:Multicopper oxidase
MTSWKDKLALTAQRNRLEIVKAKLIRREIMRLGLLTAGGSLIVKASLSSRAFGQAAPSLTDPDATLTRVPASPPVRPWVQPMPLLTLKKPVDPHGMLHGPPDGTTPIDGATRRIPHQYFSYNAANDTFGPGTAGTFIPKKFYELTIAQSQLKLHPDCAPTSFCAFDGVVPGPLIQANYGEPIVVRFHNHLPSVKVPQAYGIAEMTTNLHKGHTPPESDGNPVNYFNSINDANTINPNGLQDQHYPNVLAGFTDPQFGPAGNPSEAMSSLWYHDHHLDFTARNVYKGMFGCYNLFDNRDSGDGIGLRLPHGEYDIPIFFHDALFDSNLPDCIRPVQPGRHPR